MAAFVGVAAVTIGVANTGFQQGHAPWHGYQAARVVTGLIFSRSFPILILAIRISNSFCRFSQSRAEVPSALPSRSAVSAATGVSSLATRSMRVRGTPHALATAPAERNEPAAIRVARDRTVAPFSLRPARLRAAP
jgi:hypothetical protein